MFYFLIPFVLSIYFEFFGRWLAYKFDIKMGLYLPLGFFSFLALIYPCLLLTINNVSFYILLILFGLLVLLSLFFIVKDLKKLDKSINVKSLVFLLVVTLLLTYYSYNTSLGNLHGFDAVTYLNFVTNNIGNKALNSKDIYLNGPAEISTNYYNGQVYYYFAGVIVYVFGKVASLLKQEFFYATAYIWTFQIMFNLLFASLLSETINIVKNKKVIYLPLSILIFIFGRYYFNNIYGFFGNSLLTITISYVSLFTYLYFKTDDKKYRLISYVLLTGGCCLSSSGIYILIFYLFALYFFDYEKNELMNEYSILVVLPLLNAINMERYPLIFVYGIPLLMFILIRYLGKYISELISKYKLIKILLIAVFILTFVVSRFYSNGLFDFTGLLNNLSQKYDMTINYFSFVDDGLLLIVYKIFVIAVYLLAAIKDHKKLYMMFGLILIIAFFNPFSCNVLNHFVNVYYRAYVLIINPFTLILMFDSIMELLEKKYIFYLGILLSVVVILISNPTKPIYYHYQHEPEKDFNYIYKMNNDEMDIVRELKESINFYGEEDPYIITGNILTQSMIPNAHYLYGRNFFVSKNWSESEKELYGIFYTPEYLGDELVENPDYDQMHQYLNDAEVNYVVVDKRVEYFDPEQNNYYSLIYKVNNTCGVYPAYENDTYVIYRFEWK